MFFFSLNYYYFLFFFFFFFGFFGFVIYESAILKRFLFLELIFSSLYFFLLFLKCNFFFQENFFLSLNIFLLIILAYLALETAVILTMVLGFFRFNGQAEFIFNFNNKSDNFLLENNFEKKK